MRESTEKLSFSPHFLIFYVRLGKMPFAHSVVFIDIDEVYWHSTPYGLVIFATASVRIYFTFGDLFETFVGSPDFDPYRTVVPLTVFHEETVFPPMPGFVYEPPSGEGNPETPSVYLNSYVQSSGGSYDPFEPMMVTPLRMVYPEIPEDDDRASTSRASRRRSRGRRAERSHG